MASIPRLKFQSTPPHGERLEVPVSGACSDYCVSIHAPARGATCHICLLIYLCYLFQSTPPHGERPERRTASSCSLSRFNPRPRTGSDRPPYAGYVCGRTVSIHAPARGATTDNRWTIWCLDCFNPRPRTGSDQLQCYQRSIHLPVSIHAPARGATSWQGDSPLLPDRVSIHAPARGATVLQA